MVFQPFLDEYELELSFEYECCELIIKHSLTIFIEMNEKGC